MLKAALNVIGVTILVISAIVGPFSSAQAAQPIQANLAPLFSSVSPLEVTIEAPFSQLFAQKSETVEAKRIRVQGKITYEEKSVPVELHMRGFSSLGACEFPKLGLKFKKANRYAAKDTPFADLSKVDLGTHCGSPLARDGVFATMKFNHREALVYRWLEILEIPSYKTRPAIITYIDSANPGSAPPIEQAFFVENLDSLLERAGAVEIRAGDDYWIPENPIALNDEQIKFKRLYKNLPQHEQINRIQLSKIALFAALVGNTDYRLQRDLIWNLKLIELANGEWLPIPMDFNFAGIVTGANYEFAPEKSFYDFADVPTKIAHIEGFQAKREQLYASLASLADDPVGAAHFRTMLDRQFAQMQELKTALQKSQNP